MLVFLCLDQKNGMAFHQRRQSLDRAIRADLLTAAAGRPVWMTPYSARQFTEPEAVLRTSDAPLQETEREGLCFVEFPPLSAALDRIDTLVVYRWNRVYPTDQRLDLDLNTSFRLVSSTDIPGHSHEKITKEVYLR
ncbi:ribonuclease Z [Intestinimonas sp.]|uniref:ribonuclease Z n=1 Tax=Intestinimonas sp. TaxID=1965293 RepID=UPI0026215D26|nr:ribonuclease Z [Intestinimonas sp.]